MASVSTPVNQTQACSVDITVYLGMTTPGNHDHLPLQQETQTNDDHEVRHAMKNNVVSCVCVPVEQRQI